jgi:REP element-mobilizing transposase RayT
MQTRKRPSPPTSIPIHGPIIAFVTICSKDRKPWLATDEVHELLTQTWQAADAWLVGKYTIMPDHIHLFAAPGHIELGLDRWVTYFKSQFTKNYQKRECAWQSGMWDTWLRTQDAYEQKWEYVRNNPVRHELVERPEEWPFQGELNIVEW